MQPFESSHGGYRRAMGDYTKANLRDDVDDQAPKFGMPSEMQARFARTPLGGKTLGLSLFKLEPNFRIPFGHKHKNQEEVYVVVRGSARVKVEGKVVDLGQWDAIRIEKNTMRDVEAGPDGVEYLAFGAGEDASEVEMVQDWWSDYSRAARKRSDYFFGPQLSLRRPKSCAPSEPPATGSPLCLSRQARYTAGNATRTTITKITSTMNRSWPDRPPKSNRVLLCDTRSR